MRHEEDILFWVYLNCLWFCFLPVYWTPCTTYYALGSSAFWKLCLFCEAVESERKEKKKYKLSKLSTEPAYTQSRNHHADLLRNIENTSSFGKHYALNCWITLHFNVQICSLAFCWKDQTIWHFVWDINALGRCSIIY